MLRRPMILGLLTMALNFHATGSALAQKGGGGGGGTGGGTIFFSSGGQTWSMNSDGTGKIVYPANIGEGIPSRSPHGGYRWFVQPREVTGEPFPDGYPPQEIFAVRGDGNEAFTVRLTTDPTLQALGMPDWAPGETDEEGLVSFLGQRWVLVGGIWQIDPVSVGLYAVPVLFDADGNAIEPAWAPSFVTSFGAGISGRYAWSPDRSEVAFTGWDGSGNRPLQVVNVASGLIRTLTTWAAAPSWSPDGTKIAFGNGYGGIDVIRPDGSGRTTIIKPDRTADFWSPHWSPTGSHLAYVRDPLKSGSFISDVYRATSSGSGRTNLTSDVGPSARPLAWR